MKNATGPADVDAYLAALPDEPRAALEVLRARIRALVPEATEVVSYGIPTFRHHGGLVGFGATKRHCALYVMSPAVMSAHAAELAGYDTATATIRFAPSAPLPDALVASLVRARVAENVARAAGRPHV